MPRKPRFFLPGCSAHLVQRGNNRSAVFFDKSDYEFYLESLAKAACRFGVEIHAYVLMTNHVHLLVTPQDREGISAMMQNLGRDYVTQINYRYQRTGTLWEGRFKACSVETERYALACHRYIEMNPVRAGMVVSPEEYFWSSYHHNAVGRTNELLTPHPALLGLGETTLARMNAYRMLFEDRISEENLAQIRGCLQTGTPLGNQRFAEEIEKALEVRVGQAQRGRPRKNVKREKGL